jgi:hypothetical protein
MIYRCTCLKRQWLLAQMPFSGGLTISIGSLSSSILLSPIWRHHRARLITSVYSARPATWLTKRGLTRRRSWYRLFNAFVRGMRTTSSRRAAARFDDSNNLTAARARRHRFDDSYNLLTASLRARGIPTTRRRCRRASTKAWITTGSLGGRDYYKIWCNGCLGGSQALIHGIQRANLTPISTSREASILAQI